MWKAAVWNRFRPGYTFDRSTCRLVYRGRHFYLAGCPGWVAAKPACKSRLQLRRFWSLKQSAFHQFPRFSFSTWLQTTRYVNPLILLMTRMFLKDYYSSFSLLIYPRNDRFRTTAYIIVCTFFKLEKVISQRYHCIEVPQEGFPLTVWTGTIIKHICDYRPRVCATVRKNKLR